MPRAIIPSSTSPEYDDRELREDEEMSDVVAEMLSLGRDAFEQEELFSEENIFDGPDGDESGFMTPPPAVPAIRHSTIEPNVYRQQWGWVNPDPLFVFDDNHYELTGDEFWDNRLNDGVRDLMDVRMAGPPVVRRLIYGGSDATTEPYEEPEVEVEDVWTRTGHHRGCICFECFPGVDSDEE